MSKAKPPKKIHPMFLPENRNKCIYCGKPGARCITATGWAHKRCLP